MEVKEDINIFISKSKNAALQAIRIFNDPTFSFRTANFCILMIISWTSLIYAIFLKNKREISFKDKLFTIKVKENNFKVSNKKPLIDCIKEYFPNENNPIRKNIELFISIRNLIEHQSSKEIDSILYPEMVSLFLNYKKILFQEFNESILSDIEIFIPLIIDNKKINIQIKENNDELLSFIKDYRNSLDLKVVESDEYAFKVFLLPKLISNKNKADLSIEFIKNNETDKETLDKIYAIIKEKKINNGLTGKELTATEVVEKIKKHCDWFNIKHFIYSWKKFKIRPEQNDPSPSNTNKDFCMYTGVKNNYRYKEEYVKFLLDKIKNNEITKKV